MASVEIALLVVLLLGGGLTGRRVQLLRRGGTEVVLRVLPARPGRGWHHGVLRYRDRGLQYFRVSSLRPGPDATLDRRSLTVLERRVARPDEVGVVPVGATVLHVQDVTQEVEIALSGGSLTAFLSWVESSPPGRTRR